MPTRFVAVLFDLDGVLIDSEPLHEIAIRRTAEHLGRPATDEELFRFKGIVETCCADLLIEWTGSTLSREEIMAYRDGIYRQLFDAEIQAVPGALDFVRRCQSRGLKLALATSALACTQRGESGKASLTR